MTATPNSTVLGQNVMWSGTLTALHGYNTSVNLICAGTAPGTCTFNPSSLVPTSGGAAFTLTVGNATTATFNFNIQGSDGTLIHTQAVTLTVGTDVTWSATGSSAVTVEAGQSATYNFSAAPIGGATFSGTVSFACANLPALTSCSFNPASIAAGAGTTPVTLTIATTGPNQGSPMTRRNSIVGTLYPLPSDKHNPSVSGPGSGKPGGIGVALAWLLTLPVAGVFWAGIARRKRDRERDWEHGDVIAGSIVLVWLLVLVSCGGALSGGGGTQPLAVTVSPSIASVVIGGQQQFTANQSVTWSVTGGNNGTINASSGLYTAPGVIPSPPSVTVTATSSVAGASPGSATVTITNSAVTVTVSPASANVFADEAGNTWAASATQQQFTAAVNNGTSQNVTWAVTGGSANGTIDANGLYTSPAVVPNPVLIAVTATSAQAIAPGSATANIEAATAVGTYSNIQVTATASGGTGHGIVVALTVN